MECVIPAAIHASEDVDLDNLDGTSATWAPTKRHNGPVETVLLRSEHSTPRPFSECIGASAEAGTSTDKL